MQRMEVIGGCTEAGGGGARRVPERMGGGFAAHILLGDAYEAPRIKAKG